MVIPTITADHRSFGIMNFYFIIDIINLFTIQDLLVLHSQVEPDGVVGVQDPLIQDTVIPIITAEDMKEEDMKTEDTGMANDTKNDSTVRFCQLKINEYFSFGGKKLKKTSESSAETIDKEEDKMVFFLKGKDLVHI